MEIIRKGKEFIWTNQIQRGKGGFVAKHKRKKIKATEKSLVWTLF